MEPLGMTAAGPLPGEAKEEVGAMEPVPSGQSLLEMLAQMPDPRSKYGRRYPLTSLITAIILAALNGQSSLRGMWLWIKAHSDLITTHLPFHRNRIPALETFRTLLCRLDASLLLEIFNRWLKAANSAQISIDEKVLRGSKRDYEVPLMVVAAFSHRLGIVLEQVVAEDQDKIKAALHILERMPIKGKILTIDAGFMTQSVLRKIVEKGGLI
jgi:hypothetical protein